LKDVTTRQKFSFGYYRDILKQYADAGFAVSSFPDFDGNNPKTLILRHDVDYTLSGVLELARIEIEEGATASYLFRIHGSDYNFYAPHTQHLARELKAMGHDVGLHFEAGNYGAVFDENPPDVLRREVEIFEKMFGHPVVTASEHRDLAGSIHGIAPYHETFDPYESGIKFYAMDPKYCQDMKYLSDSNAHWREGDPLDHLGRHDRMQVLIHPDWWFKSHLLLKGPYTHGLGNG
jgi:hypothetical protein